MKILIAGDYYPGLTDNTETIKVALRDIQSLCTASDYSIVNFESPITSQWDEPIAKCGPALKTTVTAAKGLKEIGFDCVTLANNHILDQGGKTLVHTISEFDKIGLEVVGAGKNLSEAEKILYKKIGDETLAIINCCENEFSIATANTPGANPLNPVHQYYSICKAKKSADYILMIVHGGHEHYPLPSIRMQELYRYFVDCGVDAVINHHQHCYSGFEYYKNKPIIYGIGNFLFDGGNRPFGRWHEGYMVQLELQKESFKMALIPYTQCKGNFSVRLVDDKKAFSSEIQHMNTIISNPSLLHESYREWVKKNIGTYRNVCIPFRNKYLHKAASMGWIPNGLSHDRLLQLQNYMQCEAHRDMFISFLNEQFR